MKKQALKRLIRSNEENLLRQFLESANSGDTATLRNMADALGRVDELAKHYEWIRDSDGLNALHYAALGGKVHACKYLIKKVKIYIDTKDFKGETPLHHAVKGEQDAVAAYLLENGASSNEASDGGITPLHYAAQKGSREVLKLLLSKGAAVDAMAVSVGTPLSVAAYNGNEVAVEILLNHHASPDGGDLSFYQQDGLDINKKNQLHTPLGASISGSSFACVDLLVKAGAKLDVSSCGLTPLQIAAARNETEILKYLVEKGADPATYYNGMTALDLSGLNRNYEAIEILFPKTPPLPRIPNWSLDEVISHFKEYEIKCKLEECEELKTKGTDAFQKEEYADAISFYSEALGKNPDDIDILLQRSHCWGIMNASEDALNDAEACVKARPDMPLAHFRKGQAYMLLKDPAKAADSFGEALLLEPSEKDYQSALWRAIAEEFEYMRNLGDLKIIQLKAKGDVEAKEAQSVSGLLEYETSSTADSTDSKTTQ